MHPKAFHTLRPQPRVAREGRTYRLYMLQLQRCSLHHTASICAASCLYYHHWHRQADQRSCLMFLQSPAGNGFIHASANWSFSRNPRRACSSSTGSMSDNLSVTTCCRKSNKDACVFTLHMRLSTAPEFVAHIFPQACCLCQEC